MLEFCFYILSIIYDIISVVNNKISRALKQIKWDKHPPDSIFVPSSAAIYLVWICAVIESFQVEKMQLIPHC